MSEWTPQPPAADGYYWCRRRFYGNHLNDIPEIALLSSSTLTTVQGPLIVRRYRIATTGYHGPIARDWLWWPIPIEPPKA